MDNELTHPTLPLMIVNQQILGPDGVIGHVDYGEQYVYVCFFRNKLVVAEHNTFDSIVTRCVSERIREKYYYAFKILCGGQATAVIRCTSKDLVLVGVIAGYLVDGTRIWKPAKDITTWPGIKEA
jgi:hypothetical protein